MDVGLDINFQGTENFDTIYIFIGKFHTQGFWTQNLNLHLTTTGKAIELELTSTIHNAHQENKIFKRFYKALEIIQPPILNSLDKKWTSIILFVVEKVFLVWEVTFCGPE